MEVYKAVFDGVLRIQPVDAEEDSALIGNLRDGVKDDLVPVCSMGDPDTLYATAYRFDGEIPGGVVMVSGDHPSTAVAIAKELGIYEEGDEVVEGTELAAMSDRDLRCQRISCVSFELGRRCILSPP